MVKFILLEIGTFVTIQINEMKIELIELKVHLEKLQMIFKVKFSLLTHDFSFY